MAYFFRDNARDEFSGKRRGRAMHFQGQSTAERVFHEDDREAQRQHAASAMQNYENPLHKEVYNRMSDYGYSKVDRSELPMGRRMTNISPIGDRVVAGGEHDIIRRGHGNIIAPKPLAWDEVRPHRRPYGALPDEVLAGIASKSDAGKEKEISLMARCGPAHFFKGFSKQPDRHEGPKMIQQEALQPTGAGIWGFNGVGKMSREELPRRRPLRLEPIDQPMSSPWAQHSTNPIIQNSYSHDPAKYCNKFSSEVSGCLHFKDKESTNMSLRQRQERYPDPSTVPMLPQPCFTERKPRAVGGIARTHHESIFGNGMASPPGARFATREETTTGAAFAQDVPRANTSMF